MKDWYELTQRLDTEVSPLDELSASRITVKVLKALPHRRRPIRLIAALIAVFLLSTCGYAAVSQYSHWFWNRTEVPRTPVESENLLASMGTVINQTQTVDGVTATLHGALLDTNTILLSLSFEGADFPDALWSNVQSYDSWLYLSEAQIKQNWAKSFNMTEEEVDAYFEEYQVSLQEWRYPDHMTYVHNQQSDTFFLQIEDTVPFSGDMLELTLHLENLSVQHRAGPELLTSSVEGPFEFTFTAERKNVRQVWFGAFEFPLTDDVSVLVDKIALSPFHAEVEFSGIEPLAVDSRGKPILRSADYDIEDFRLTALRISGEEIDIASERSTSSSMAGPDGSWSGSVSKGPLSRIIDPATVEAVKVNDTWLELKYASPMESRN